jgi:hypothetical protein
MTDVRADSGQASGNAHGKSFSLGLYFACSVSGSSRLPLTRLLSGGLTTMTICLETAICWIRTPTDVKLPMHLHRRSVWRLSEVVCFQHRWRLPTIDQEPHCGRMAVVQRPLHDFGLDPNTPMPY